VPLLVEQRGPVRWFVIDRPDKRNAMTSAMRRLGELLTTPPPTTRRASRDLRRGGNFSSGLDRADRARMAQKSEFPVKRSCSCMEADHRVTRARPCSAEAQPWRWR
jgi:enoyl-CoA hydratase/carnithine racemase